MQIALEQPKGDPAGPDICTPEDADTKMNLQENRF